MTRVNLDRVETYGAVDAGGMRAHIAGMPDRLREVWQGLRGVELPEKHADIFNFIVLGIGGAALAGDLLYGLVAHTAQIPVIVARGYDLPAFVGPDSTAVAVSHSGNTQETLALFETAVDRGVKPVILTTGGALEGLATTHRAPLVRYPADLGVPAALGAEFLALAAIARAVHLSHGDLDAAVAEGMATLAAARDACGPDVPTARNPAKQTAMQLAGKSVLITGTGHLAPVARCWKGQLNGYAKTAAFADTLPDANHTTLMGFDHPATLPQTHAVVQLRSSYDHPQVRAHGQVLTDWLAARGVATEIVAAQGQGRLAQMLHAMAVGDWTAYYLALLNGVDPTEEAAIAHMKRALA